MSPIDTEQTLANKRQEFMAFIDTHYTSALTAHLLTHPPARPSPPPPLSASPAVWGERPGGVRESWGPTVADMCLSRWQFPGVDLCLHHPGMMGYLQSVWGGWRVIRGWPGTQFLLHACAGTLSVFLTCDVFGEEYGRPNIFLTDFLSAAFSKLCI